MRAPVTVVTFGAAHPMPLTTLSSGASVKPPLTPPPAGKGPAISYDILVVDDEEDLLELVRYTLSKEGHAITCAGTGEDALKVARKQPPDLIVLDLMLPGIDGLEVCRRLKGDSKTRDIPIIMLTASLRRRLRSVNW